MNENAAGLTRRQILGAAAIGIASAAAVQAPARAAEPIRIGFAMSLTGPGAGAGKTMLVGREIWKDEINAKGGLLGRPVQFVYYDDQSNPGNVPGLYAKLIDLDRVDLLCSSFGTNQIAPAMPIVMARNMVYMGLFGTGVNDTFRYDRYFQILPNGPEGNRSLSLGFFEAARTIRPAPRTVALTGEDTEFGQNILAGARANVARLGLQVVYDRSFPVNTVDHTPVVRAIQSTQPDLVFAAVPAGHDAYVLAHVLHDWDDKQCLSILRACRRAMHRDARLLIVETALPDDDAPHPGKLLDLVMLTVTGGRERTGQEFSDLLAAAELRLVRVVPIAAGQSIVEAAAS